MSSNFNSIEMQANLDDSTPSTFMLDQRDYDIKPQGPLANLGLMAAGGTILYATGRTLMTDIVSKVDNAQVTETLQRITSFLENPDTMRSHHGDIMALLRTIPDAIERASNGYSDMSSTFARFVDRIKKGGRMILCCCILSHLIGIVTSSKKETWTHIKSAMIYLGFYIVFYGDMGLPDYENIQILSKKILQFFSNIVDKIPYSDTVFEYVDRYTGLSRLARDTFIHEPGHPMPEILPQSGPTFEGVVDCTAHMFALLASIMSGRSISVEWFRNLCSIGRLKDALSDVMGFIISTLETVYNKFLASEDSENPDLRFFTSSNEKHNDFLNLCYDIEKLNLCGKLYANNNSILKIDAALIKGRAILASWPRGRYEGLASEIKARMGKLSTMKSLLTADMIAPKGTRVETTGVMIRGGPGTGKSITLGCMSKAVAFALCDEDERKEFKENPEDFYYNRFTEHKYWDGWKYSHKVVQFDDFGQTTDAKGNLDNEYMNWIRCVNSHQYILHMADMESKGVTTFNALAAIASTNELLFSGVESIKHIGALERRIHIDVLQVPKKEYAIQSSLKKNHTEWKFDPEKLPKDEKGVTVITPDACLYYYWSARKCTVDTSKPPMNFSQLKEKILERIKKAQDWFEALNRWTTKHLEDSVNPTMSSVKGSNGEILPQSDSRNSRYEDRHYASMPYNTMAREEFQNNCFPIEKARSIDNKVKYMFRPLLDEFYSMEDDIFMHSELQQLHADRLSETINIGGVEVPNPNYRSETHTVDSISGKEYNIEYLFSGAVLEIIRAFKNSNIGAPVFTDKQYWFIHTAFLALYNPDSQTAGLPLLVKLGYLLTDIGMKVLDHIKIMDDESYTVGTKMEYLSVYWARRGDFHFSFTVMSASKFEMNSLDSWKDLLTSTLKDLRQNVHSPFLIALDICKAVLASPVMVISTMVVANAAWKLLKWLVSFLPSNLTGIFGSVISIMKGKESKKEREALKKARAQAEGEEIQPISRSNILVEITDNEGRTHLVKAKLAADGNYIISQSMDFNVVGRQRAEKARPSPHNVKTAEEVRMMFMPKSQSGGDVMGDQLIKKIATTSVYNLSVESGEKDKWSNVGNILFIGGRIALMPYHYIKPWMYSAAEEQEVLKNRIRIQATGKNSSQKTYFANVGVVLSNVYGTNMMPNDAILVKFPSNYIPSLHVDRIRNFCKESDVKNLPADRRHRFTMPSQVGGSIYLHTGDTQVNLETIEVNGLDTGTYTVHRTMCYNSMTKSGDCGAPMCLLGSHRNNRRIFGIHVAGGNLLAYSAIITQEMLQSAMDEMCDPDYKFALPFDDKFSIVPQSANSSLPERFSFNGNLIPAPPSYYRSRIHRSELYNTYYPSGMLPANLMPANGVDPLTNSINKYSLNFSRVDDHSLKFIADQLFDHLAKVSHPPSLCRVLTPREAIYGIPDLDSFSSIPFTTSPGFPGNCDGYEDLKEGLNVPPSDFSDRDVDPDHPYWRLIDQVQECIDIMNAGIRPFFVFCDFPKDETLPAEKVRINNKVRNVSNCPIVYTVIMKMFFGSFCAWLKENRITNSIGVGTNVYSDEWDQLFKYMSSLDISEEIPFADDGDYGGFDGSHTQQLLQIVLYLVEKFFFYYSVPTIQETRIREMAWQETLNANHCMRGILYSWVGSLSSGHPMTVEINCLINLLIFRLAWYYIVGPVEFVNHVRLIVYGDDVLYTVRKAFREKYNGETICEFIKTMGYKFTSGTKDAASHNYRPLTDNTFLKRHFRYEPCVGRYVGPLLLNSVLNIPMWVKGNDCFGELVEENVETAIKELSLHPDIVFDKFRDAICNSYSFYYGKDVDPFYRRSSRHVICWKVCGIEGLRPIPEE